MSLIAEFELSNPILADVRREFPELEYDVVDEYVSADGAPKLTAWAVGDASTLERFHGSIPADPTVVDATMLADLGDRRLYRLELTGEGTAGLTYPRAVEEGITFLDVRASSDAVRYRAQIPDRESLVTFRQLCADRDLEFELRGLYHGESDGREATTLTDRQREVLRTAFEGATSRSLDRRRSRRWRPNSKSRIRRCRRSSGAARRISSQKRSRATSRPWGREVPADLTSEGS